MLSGGAGLLRPGTVSGSRDASRRFRGLHGDGAGAADQGRGPGDRCRALCAGGDSATVHPAGLAHRFRPGRSSRRRRLRLPPTGDHHGDGRGGRDPLGSSSHGTRADRFCGRNHRGDLRHRGAGLLRGPSAGEGVRPAVEGFLGRLGGTAGRPASTTRGGGPLPSRRHLSGGRPRGGLTSKIHLACDGRGRPLDFALTGGNTNDCTRFTAVMETIRVPRIGPGRPRVRPDHVLGDKGYSSKAIRSWLRRRGIPHTIPERADQVRNRARRGSRGGRPPAFDRETYKHRNVVKRRFNRLKQWRGIATRYDKTAESYEAAVTLASILMWA
ncbi:hypothetical protein C5L38_34265 (plasmid) [Streptomyces sp. WAC00288]|nr:hypothetical protein C5L38_34265 [Streptomyces sp. WAC00288]